MNSININGLGNLNNLCATQCTNFKAAQPLPESTLPEQHDMVSLGQNMADISSPAPDFSDVNSTPSIPASSADSAPVSANVVAKPNNSVDAGNGLRATMSDIGVLAMLDEPSTVSGVDLVQENQFSEANEMQNTLSMINLNSLESILSDGLIALNS